MKQDVEHCPPLLQLPYLLGPQQHPAKQKMKDIGDVPLYSMNHLKRIDTGFHRNFSALLLTVLKFNEGEEVSLYHMYLWYKLVIFLLNCKPMSNPI